MSYQTELNRLQSIITADSSTDEQREAAREAKSILIDNRIDDLLKEFEDRTEQYNALIERLKGVVDKISANQLTGVIDGMNDVVKDVQAAAGTGDNG
ncbi:MAG: hypothetical protein O6949_01175 [Chloroflexi bacterium]|nr:hypothetical protein [Chloroflexota bacterium]